MPLRIRCPVCQSLLQVADANRGQKVRCPKCNGIMQVPAPPVAAPAPERPPMAIPLSTAAPAVVPSPVVQVPAGEIKAVAPAALNAALVSPASPIAATAPTPVPPEDVPVSTLSDLEELGTAYRRPRAVRNNGKTGRLGDWLPVVLKRKKHLPWIAGGGGVLLVLIVTLVVTNTGGHGDTVKVAPHGKSSEAAKTQPKTVAVTDQPLPEPPLPPQVEVPMGPAPAQIGPETMRKVKKATVYLRVQQGNGMVGEGSGFFAVEPGLILTNAHVLGMLLASSPGPKEVEVVVNSGEKDEFNLQAIVKGVDRQSDLAVLSVIHQQERWPAPLPVGSSLSLTDLQKVYVFGFPGGYKVGKSITPGEATFTVLRKVDGKPRQIQVQGGMWHGNSGGPVVDSRGVVVGVAVAGIEGSQIHFAIPADHVENLRHGRVTRLGFGEPFHKGKRIKLPVELECLDPLERIREIKLSVWTSPLGMARAGSMTPPAPPPADGARQEFPVEYHDGKAEPVEVALPAAAWDFGKVVWVQPVLTSGGRTYPGDPVAYKVSAFDPLDLKPALLQYKFDAPQERTVKVRAESRIQEVRAAELPDAQEERELEAQETVRPEAGGGAYHLQIRSGKAAMMRGAHTEPYNPTIAKLIQGRAYDFVTDTAGSLVKRVKRESLKSGESAQVREQADLLTKDIANALEMTCLAVAGKELQPKETWECRLRCHMPVTTFHGIQTKVENLEILTTCTALGTRMHQGQREAQVALKGTLRDRNGNQFTGHFTGNVHFSLDKGYVSRADMRVEIETAPPGRELAMLTSEVHLTRSAQK